MAGLAGRRTVLLGALTLGLANVLPRQSAAADARAAWREAAQRFSAKKTLTGDFVQIAHDGRQAEGRLFLERPGRVRFDYAGDGLTVIADGKTMAVNNGRLGTWDLYPLSRTPLSYVLGDVISIPETNILSANLTEGLLKVVLHDPNRFGRAQITLYFDAKGYDLRQWSILDETRRETTIMAYNLRDDVRFAPDVFRIPYAEIRSQKL